MAEVSQALDRLHDSYGDDENDTEFHQLRFLTGKELGELEDGIALFKKRGIPAAASVMGTDVGKRTMDSIGAIIGTMRNEAAVEAAAANAEWRCRLSPLALGFGRRRTFEYRPRVVGDSSGLQRHAPPRPPGHRPARSEI